MGLFVCVVAVLALGFVAETQAQFSSEDVGNVRECFGVQEVAGCNRFVSRTPLPLSLAFICVSCVSCLYVIVAVCLSVPRSLRLYYCCPCHCRCWHCFENVCNDVRRLSANRRVIHVCTDHVLFQRAAFWLFFDSYVWRYSSGGNYTESGSYYGDAVSAAECFESCYSQDDCL